MQLTFIQWLEVPLMLGSFLIWMIMIFIDSYLRWFSALKNYLWLLGYSLSVVFYFLNLVLFYQSYPGAPRLVASCILLVMYLLLLLSTPKQSD